MYQYYFVFILIYYRRGQEQFLGKLIDHCDVTQVGRRL